MRPVQWHDLPLVYRLARHGTSLDARISLTIGNHSLRKALLAGTGQVHTYILRSQHGAGLAQLRHSGGEQHAHVAYLAPTLEQGADESLWLEMLDGLAVMAGQRRAVGLSAEVAEDGQALEVLRRAGFAMYARQDLWQRAPEDVPPPALSLRRAGPLDAFAVTALYRNLVPGLIQQVESPPMDADVCYVLDGTEGPQAVVSAHRGPAGTLIETYLHPEAHHQALEIIGAVLAILRADTRPVFCRLRRYEGWQGETLRELGFERLGAQAVMVRHIAVRAARPAFEPVPVIKGGVTTMTTLMVGQDKRPLPLRRVSRPAPH